MYDDARPETVSVGEALVHARRLLQKHPQEAAEQAAAVISAEPGLAEAHLLLAIALRSLGRLDEAQVAEQDAIQCALKDSIIVRASNQISVGEYAGADHLLGLYLADTPNDAVAIHLRGLIQLKLDRRDEAIRLFRRSLALAPSYDPARRDLNASTADANQANSSSDDMVDRTLPADEEWFTSEWGEDSESDPSAKRK